MEKQNPEEESEGEYFSGDEDAAAIEQNCMYNTFASDC